MNMEQSEPLERPILFSLEKESCFITFFIILLLLENTDSRPLTDKSKGIIKNLIYQQCLQSMTFT